MGIGDWGLGIGDWGLAQSPIPNPQFPIPKPQYPPLKIFIILLTNLEFFNLKKII